MLYRCFGFELF